MSRKVTVAQWSYVDSFLVTGVASSSLPLSLLPEPLFPSEPSSVSLSLSV